MAALPLVIPSPLHQLEDIFPFHCWIKRDDLIHHEISGNKYRKLKYLIQFAQDQLKKGILTFGGPFSNHIYATAAYTHLIEMPSAGIIRGDQDWNNPTIRFAMDKGMKIHCINRKEYKNKNSEAILEVLYSYPEYLVIPEGGYHTLALQGVNEIVEELDFIPDYIACSIGTGATAAGLLRGIARKGWSTKLMAFASMKNKSLRDQILKLAGISESNQLLVMEDFHRGGYAKLDSELLNYSEWFVKHSGIKLDPIYTLKMLFGLEQLSRIGYFKPEDRVLIYHSGGIQGWNGINYLLKKKPNVARNSKQVISSLFSSIPGV